MSVGYESLSNELVSNAKLELQAQGENGDALVRALPLDGVKRVLDVGCGSGAMTRSLARLLPPETQIYGLDISESHILGAGKLARDEGLRNVHYLVGDILQPPGELLHSFDLVFEKYVMMSMVPRALGRAFLSQMSKCACANGRVVCIEADINFGQERFPPPPETLSKVLPRIVDYYREEGLIEWRCGIQLYHYFKLAGFSEPEVKLVDGRTIAGGSPKELVEHDNVDVEQLIRPCLELMGLPELTDEVAREWRSYLLSSDTFSYTPIFMGIGSMERSRVNFG
jgi:ubiquinone/menaquinone biosynthesis C-methylase UbiE